MKIQKAIFLLLTNQPKIGTATAENKKAGKKITGLTIYGQKVVIN